MHVWSEQRARKKNERNQSKEKNNKDKYFVIFILLSIEIVMSDLYATLTLS